MPEISIRIGNRDFDVACQKGEESFLLSAAKMLDTEATTLTSQMGRLPAERMLLMAGLMLADKTVEIEDQKKQLEKKLEEDQSLIQALKDQPSPEPEKIEVPVVPQSVSDTLAELAARAESLATELETKNN